MTDPDEHAWVARLLAETPPETMPADVAARLDATLADLTEAALPEREAALPESETAPAGTGAVRLEFDAARRADRPERSLGRVARAVLAVAAVVVLVAGGALMSSQLSLPSGISSSDSGTAAGGSAGSRAGTPEAVPSVPSGPFGADELDAMGQGGEVPSLTTDGYAAQVAAVLRADAVADRQDSPPAPLSAEGDSRFRTETPPAGCSPTTPPGVDRSLPARLDGRSVVLEISSASGDRRLVRAVGCDGTVLASATVPRS